MSIDRETISLDGPIDLYEGIVTVPPALIVVFGPNLGKTYYLQQDEHIIGRSPSCDIHLDDDSISRRHAKITVAHNQTTVHDLDSTNGVFINGHQLPRAVLKDGDRLHLGETVFKYLSSTNAESKFHDDVYHMMTVDDLTQVFNRQYLQESLKRELSRALRYKRCLSLALLDIDRFKTINDTYGHLAGDEILREFAALIGRNIRESDLLARYGGDEFAIILPEADPVAAMRFCEKLCAMIASHHFHHGQKTLNVTASIGLQCYEYTDGAKAGSQLVAAADARLYEAKQAGRNRICTGVFE